MDENGSGRTSYPVRLLMNPWVGGGLILGIFSLALNVYYYKITKSEPDLTYYVNPIRTVVLKKGEASGLRVLHGNEEIKSDITAAQIAIWNRGKRSIRSADVLSSIQIITKPTTRILEASVRNTTRPVIDLTIDTNHLVEGRLPLSWRILERNDGGTIQLILAGPAEVALTVDGIIEGQARISHLRGVLKTPGPEVYEPLTQREALIFIISLLSFALIMRVVEVRFPGRSKSSSPVASLIFAIMAIAVIVLWLMGRLRLAPPFEL